MMNDADRKLLADVSTHGWHCVHVRGDSQGPGYTFSVGLYRTHGHPELMVMGLDPEVAHPILGLAVEQIKQGHVYRDGFRDDTLLDGVDCMLRKVPPALHRKYVGYCSWFYKDRPDGFEALQILWPDSQGRYPGQEGFEMDAMQPALT